MHEIITLQFGPFANFCGAHYWNLQDEQLNPDFFGDEAPDVDSSFLYREGMTEMVNSGGCWTLTVHLQGAPTYTPRTMFFDLGENLGPLRPNGYLYNQDDEPTSSWGHGVTTIASPPVEKNPYLRSLEQEPVEGADDPSLQLDMSSMVKSWGDYLKLHLHPRSVMTVQGAMGEGFSDVVSGMQMIENAEFLELAMDRLRLFFEECDLVQGLQVIAEMSGGFAPLCHSMLQYVNEECKVPILTFSVAPYEDPALLSKDSRCMKRQLSTGWAVKHWSDVSSLVVPLSTQQWLDRRQTASEYGVSTFLPFLDFEPTLPFESSAILGTAIDAVTAPFRLSKQSIEEGGQHPDVAIRMNDIVSLLQRRGGMRTASLSVGLPFPLPRDVLEEDCRFFWEGSTPIHNAPPAIASPLCFGSDLLTTTGISELAPFAHYGVLRGLGEVSKPRAVMLNAFKEYADRSDTAFSGVFTVRQSLPLPTPYPRMFNGSLIDPASGAGWKSVHVPEGQPADACEGKVTWKSVLSPSEDLIKARDPAQVVKDPAITPLRPSFRKKVLPGAIAVMGHMQTSKASQYPILSVLHGLKKRSLRLQAHCDMVGLTEDVWKEVEDALSSLADQYNE